MPGKNQLGSYKLPISTKPMYLNAKGRYNNIDIVIFNFFLIITTLAFTPDFIFGLAVIIWGNSLIYSLRDLGNRGMLFAFNIAFFFFLIGRELCQEYFEYEDKDNVEIFGEKIIIHAHICLILSVCFYFGSYVYFYKKRHYRISEIDSLENLHYKKIIRRLSRWLYWLTLAPSIVYTFILGLLAQKYGYDVFYLAANTSASRSSIILVILNRLEMMLPVALCVLLATMPTKKECNRVSIFYLIYLVLTLQSGQRGPCVLGFMFLMVYYLYRNKYSIKHDWINKTFVYIGIISIPFILTGLSAYSHMRKGEKVTVENLSQGVLDFIYDQGVSINVIKRAYEFERSLPPDRLYSMNFFHDGVFLYLTGDERIVGNSEENALYGYSLAHSLSYIVMKNEYLLGRGMGSSYVAELYHDFGYLGVILGNILYGLILSKLTFFSNNKIFTSTIKLIIIRELLWAPRGSYTEFISIFFVPSTLMAILFIFIGAKILSRKSFKYIVKH